MPYSIARSTSTAVAINLPDNNVNESDTSLSLIGRNYPSYVPKLAENFLHLLENFSSPDSPNNPIPGQLWYNYDPANSNLSANKLSVFDGLQWRNINLVTTTTDIANPGLGDILTQVQGVTSTTIQIWNGGNWVNPTNLNPSITSLSTASSATSQALIPIFDNGDSFFSITKQNFLSDVLINTGMILTWPMSVIPNGWLACDGTEYSTSTYANLYNVIGLKYSVNPPASTGNFCVPNLPGLVSIGTVVTMNYIIKT
jgi:hypothetical protein